MNICTYLRTSTNDGRQSTENQRLACQDYAKQHGWTIVAEYEDQMSGRKLDRPAFKRLLADAHKNEKPFQLVLCWSIDRWSRSGPLSVLLSLNELAECGIGFKSLKESYLDELGSFQTPVISLLGWVASAEAARLSDRIKAGLKRARLVDGRILGRPRVELPVEQVLTRRREGASLRTLAKEFGNVSIMTIKRLVDSHASSQQQY